MNEKICDTNTMLIAISGIATVLSVIISAWAQIRRDKNKEAYAHEMAVQERNWQLEDRAAKQQELRTEFAKATEGANVMIDKIDQNTEISRTAFQEANRTNEKLVDIRKEVLNKLEQMPGGKVIVDKPVTKKK